MTGVPLRTAHEAVGGLIRQSEERGCRLADLPSGEFERVRPGLAGEASQILGVEKALAAFQGPGSTAPAEVAKQIVAWRTRLGGDGV